MLGGFIAEAAVRVVGVERLVAERRSDRVRPVVADRRGTLKRDIRGDAEAADICHDVHEPFIVDVIVHSKTDNRIDPALRTTAVDRREERGIDAEFHLIVLVPKAAGRVELHILDGKRQLVTNKGRRDDLFLLEVSGSTQWTDIGFG